MKTITATQLRKLKACEDQVLLFEKHFGETLTIKSKRHAAALGRKWGSTFDVDWFAYSMLSDRAEYEKVCDAAWGEYMKMCGAALAEYKNVCGAAWAEYDKVTNAAMAEYKKVTSPAWAEYEKVCVAAAMVAYFEQEELK